MRQETCRCLSLADLVVKYGLCLHAYADDTQLYFHFYRSELMSSAVQLERCVQDIGHCMSANRLKLNADKTALLFIACLPARVTPVI